MIKIELDDILKGLIEKGHIEDIEDRIKKRIEEIHLMSDYKRLDDYFFNASGEIDEKKLKKLILGNKSDLIGIIKSIGKIPLKKKDPFEKLYTNFTNRPWSKSLLEKLNVRVCPYCNRQYTFTLANAGIRPQFDHFFPKKFYPYLSVSLYNLIPSCSICNSKKHALDTYEYDLYYPFEDEFGSDVVFQTSPIDNDFSYWTGTSDIFDIKVECKDEKQNSKVKNLNDYLKIELLYKEHKDYVRDIIRNAVIYNDSRIDELLEQFPNLFQSKNEVINSIFMSNISKEGWEKRPLSKLTHDIYEEFKIFSSK
ncbi:HNH nuclease [Bacillus toyonensis]|uniref:HNH nuclease n=1 Tax=Bacillus toyonensis TaxID=155322 RepID=UPI000BFBF684|nr:HNH nuclease [Bacillus toyonensis]PHF12219.1 HNH nuclease [Bacillus toyonensis]PHF38993.1 HNH nuclease [Bacillus toyonensis]